LKSEQAIAEATKIVAKASDRGIALRILGAVAFRIHCSGSADLYESIDRVITDLDFAAYSKQKRQVLSLFESLGYSVNNSSLLLYEDRFIMDGGKTGVHVDVFFDRLDMCHVVNWKARLELDSPTISLADLLLEKMQIVRLESKDIKDTILLFLNHDIGGGDREEVDLEYLRSVLSSDWGFYHTVITNLERVRNALAQTGWMNNGLKAQTDKRIERLVAALENCPKTIRWRMRARIGTRRQWYRDVEERVR
jgi:hypothetical protein